MIKKLIRQSSRYAIASKQDNNPLINVLHANYAASYMFALKDIFSDNEIEYILGSKENRLKYEKEIIDIQDKSTKMAVKICPKYGGETSYLNSLSGQL